VIPDDHSRCLRAREVDRCLKCQADGRLRPTDLTVVWFLQYVQDQAVTVVPFATQDKKIHKAPRMEGWLAWADVLGIPQGPREWLFTMTRALWLAVEEGTQIGHLLRLPPDDPRFQE